MKLWMHVLYLVTISAWLPLPFSPSLSPCLSPTLYFLWTWCARRVIGYGWPNWRTNNEDYQSVFLIIKISAHPPKTISCKRFLGSLRVLLICFSLSIWAISTIMRNRRKSLPLSSHQIDSNPKRLSGYHIRATVTFKYFCLMSTYHHHSLFY